MTSVLQIACDESGSEGENLTATSAPVLAHASIDLKPAEASLLVEEIRTLTGSNGPELKSHLFLGKNKMERAAWILERLAGRGAANITDKRYFVCAKIIALIVEPVMRSRGESIHEDGRAHSFAEHLYRSGPELGLGTLDDLLNAFNMLVRIDRSGSAKGRSDRFFATVTDVRAISTSASVRHILGLVRAGEKFGREIEQDRTPILSRFLDMEPLLSSVAATAKYWSLRTNDELELIHDETSALTQERIDIIVNGLRTPHPALAAWVPSIPLRGITLKKSHLDDRIQIADILAGIVKDVASAALSGREHPLMDRVGLFIDRESMWCDQRSWDLIYRPAELKTLNS